MVTDIERKYLEDKGVTVPDDMTDGIQPTDFSIHELAGIIPDDLSINPHDLDILTSNGNNSGNEKPDNQKNPKRQDLLLDLL